MAYTVDIEPSNHKWDNNIDFVTIATREWPTVVLSTLTEWHPDDVTLVGWLVVLGLTALWDSISVYIGPSPKEREKEEGKDRGE